MKLLTLVPAVLLMIAMPNYADEPTGGVAEPGCSLDIAQDIPLQHEGYGVLRVSGCEREGRFGVVLPAMSMSVRGPLSDELGIMANGQYRKVSGEAFSVSELVNTDMALELRLDVVGSRSRDNTALFELSYR